MNINRRSFVKGIGAAGACLFLPTHNVLGANDRVNIAIAGLNKRGKNHIAAFSKLPNVNIIALCDPDTKVLDAVAASVPTAKKFQDYRKVLEMKELDALVIVTNHADVLRLTDNQLQESMLHFVCVLIFVDQDITPTILITISE